MAPTTWAPTNISDLSSQPYRYPKLHDTMHRAFFSRAIPRPFVLFATLLLPASAVTAQIASPDVDTALGNASTNPDDKLITLSPFVVVTKKDEGYRVTNSLGGTKMDTAVKDLPFSDEVITSEFIRDIGAHSVVEERQVLDGGVHLG